MITPSNITRHELIGLEIKVVRSRNQSLTGKQGKVVDETRNTLIIEENGKRAKLPKQDIVFQAKIHGKTLEVDGKHIVGRPEDRIKK